MDIEIIPDFIKECYVIWYNVSFTDYSLMIKTENGSIELGRVSKNDLKIIKEALDKFFKEGI